MEEAFLRFPHLSEQILEQLNNESLANSRMVAISWREFIDDMKYLLEKRLDEAIDKWLLDMHMANNRDYKWF